MEKDNSQPIADTLAQLWKQLGINITLVNEEETKHFPKGPFIAISRHLVGDLDYLLVDLPPGTGDVAISLGQLLSKARSVVITTPQSAAATVAERSGAIGLQTGQEILGVIENLSYLPGDNGNQYIFGQGGGQARAVPPRVRTHVRHPTRRWPARVAAVRLAPAVHLHPPPALLGHRGHRRAGRPPADFDGHAPAGHPA
mgnify:CR=1 FL=1